MKKISEKYWIVLTAILSVISIIITIVAFLDTEIINRFLYAIDDNNWIIGIFSSFVVAIFISMYSHLIRKILKRKKVCVFLSYAHSSKQEIDKIRKVLLSTNNYIIHDFDSISVGQDIHAEITKMIDASKLFVILFDERYFQSEHCSTELKMVAESGKIVIPILKSNDYVSKLPSEIMKLKYLVVSDDDTWEKTFEQSLYEQYRKLRGIKND